MGTIAGVFPIGDTGEQFVIAEWEPDPEVLRQQMLKFAVDTENMIEPLTAAKEAFIYDTSLHFETQSDPYGRAWTPLEEQYERRRQREGAEGNILHVTGRLEEAATAGSNWIVTEREILFDVAGLSEMAFYGPYHQIGTMDEMTQQVLTKIRTGQELTSAEGKYSYPDAGRGHNLPQRMFIGADEDTIAEVEEIFLKWLDGLIRQDLPPIPVLPTGFYSGGEFPIMKFITTGQPLLRTPSGPRFGRK